MLSAAHPYVRKYSSPGVGPSFLKPEKRYPRIDFSSVGWCVGKQLRLSSGLDNTYFAEYSK